MLLGVVRSGGICQQSEAGYWSCNKLDPMTVDGITIATVLIEPLKLLLFCDDVMATPVPPDTMLSERSSSGSRAEYILPVNIVFGGMGVGRAVDELLVWKRASCFVRVVHWQYLFHPTTKKNQIWDLLIQFQSVVATFSGVAVG